MDILIKGVDMPKAGKPPIWLVIHSDGRAECSTGEYGWRKTKAIPVPTPHGRLVDADAMENKFKESYGVGISFNGVPTIIEAEESDMEESRG